MWDSDLSLETPPSQHVDVWRIDLAPTSAPSDILLPRSGSLAEAELAPEEFARARRFVNNPLQTRFCAAHIGLRRILGRYLQCSAANVPITTEDLGRPILDATLTNHAARLHFNLTHSAGCALLAVASSGEIGVDIEEVREMDSRPGIDRQVYTEDERKRLLEADATTWFSYWTGKEAVLKATGRGFHLDPRRVEISPDLSKAIIREDDCETTMHVNALPQPPGWSAALAAQWPINGIHQRDFLWQW